jgi:hypothetical protein
MVVLQLAFDKQNKEEADPFVHNMFNIKLMPIYISSYKWIKMTCSSRTRIIVVATIGQSGKGHFHQSVMAALGDQCLICAALPLERDA